MSFSDSDLKSQNMKSGCSSEGIFLILQQPHESV